MKLYQKEQKTGILKIIRNRVINLLSFEPKSLFFCKNIFFPNMENVRNKLPHDVRF